MLANWYCYLVLTKAIVGILNNCCFKWKTHTMVKLKKKKIQMSKDVLIKILSKSEDPNQKVTQI